jgi:chorismate dehydratase
MKIVKLSAVSYLNTLPFIYGIQNSGFLHKHELSLNVPSECARKLKDDESDISLIPVGALPTLLHYNIISDYCIGASGKVRTVLLLSNHPLDQIKQIYLDGDSRTSVLLVRVLSKYLWKICPRFEPLGSLSLKDLPSNTGVVLIGDKTFFGRTHFKYCYDLAEEWFKLTNLPFVFAAWVSNKEIPGEFIQQLNNAFSWGLSHKQEAVDSILNPIISKSDLLSYLENDIRYDLDKAKQKGMELFLSYLPSIK